MERFFIWLLAKLKGKKCKDCLYFNEDESYCRPAYYKGNRNQSREDDPCGTFFDKTKR